MTEAPAQATIAPHLAEELDHLTALLSHAERGAWAFALYNTVANRREVVEALKERLTIPVYDFTVTKEYPSPLAYLHKLTLQERQERAVIFFYDVEQGFPELLGHLDLQRERLLRYPHSLVFWVTEYGRVEVATEAPNFWSRRSAVFDFRLPGREAVIQARGIAAGEPVQYQDLEEWESKMRLYQGLLAEYQADEEPDYGVIASLQHKIGVLYYYVGDYQAALEWYEKSVELWEKLGDQAGLAISYNDIGLIYNVRGDYQAALEWHEKSVEIREKLGDQAGLAETYNNIGTIFHARGDYQAALEWYEKSAEIQEKLGDRAGLATTYNNIGGIYHKQRDYQAALEWYEKSSEICEKLGHQVGLATSYNNIGEIFRVRGDYQAALEWHEKSVAIREKLGDQAGLATTYNNIALICQAQGDVKQAITYFERSLAILKAIGAKARAETVRDNLERARELNRE